ncbi:MAG: protein kinase [Roseburia sp.]|nr:protein kinase [Roseburia sp.]
MNFCYSCMRQLPNQKLNTCPYCGEMLNRPAAVPDVLPQGTPLQGKFVIGRLLGAGGFGNTYIGWNHVLSCRVAIKEFFPRYMSKRGADGRTISISDVTLRSRYEQSLRSFLEEARSLAELGSVPGIPDVYGYFEENGTGYIVMEYLEGITVKQLLKDSGGKLNYEWSRQIMLSVLYTLKEIHRRGILHRDIAPDNIMITSEGIIKLIDFGVAKKWLDDAEDPVIMLKEGYSPPEQYARGAAQGVYTDLYSVAATFYHMLTGEKPPGARIRMGQDMLPPLSSYGVQIPKPAEMAIMMCLYLQPEYRLGSAEEFMTALQGRDFKPIVELKQRVDSVGEKKPEKKNWEFPLAGKIASMLFLAAVVAAGVIIVMPNRSEHRNIDSDSNVAKAESVLGMSETDANEKLKENEVTFEPNEVIFDKSVKDGSEILTQEPAAGEAVSDGMIKGTVLSSEKCMYDELLDQKDNVYSLAENFGIDKSQLQPSEEKDASDKSKKFQNLYGVILNDGTKLNLKDLEKREKDNAILELSDVQTVTYYTSPYLYKKKLGNYVGQNISQVSFTSYTAGKNGARKKAGTGTPTCDSRYYSFEKEKGDIVKQNVKAGKTYDASKMEGALFVTIKERLYRQESETADALIKRLKDRGFKVKEKGSGSEVASVTVSGKGGAKYFTKSDAVTVMRKEKVVPKATKKPKSQSKPSDQLMAASFD